MSTCFFAYCTKTPGGELVHSVSSTSHDNKEEVSCVNAATNLKILQKRLSYALNKEIPLEHVSRLVFGFNELSKVATPNIENVNGK